MRISRFDIQNFKKLKLSKTELSDKTTLFVGANKNENQGKDSSISRTRRLFYVACTRAKQSLALVAYTHDKESVKQTVLNNKWFCESEIELI